MRWTRSPCFTPSQKYGTCRKEEVAFYRRWRGAGRQTHNLPPYPSTLLDTASPAVGYVLTLLIASNACYELFNPVPLAANEQQRIKVLVLSAVDSMLDNARVASRLQLCKGRTMGI